MTAPADGALRPCPVCGAPSARPYANPFGLALATCRGCGVRYLGRLPDETELAARYEREHEEGKWAALFQEASVAERARRARMLRDLAGGAGARLLDVGCGDGGFLDAAVAVGWRAAGLEISPSALAGVRHPVAVAPLAAVAPSVGLAAITFWDVLEHVPDPAAMVARAADLLAPGGVLALSMPSAAGTEALLRGRAWRYHDLGAYGHLLHPAPRHMRRLLEEAGLTVVVEETSGSVDLRDLVDPGRRGRAVTWILDRLSGLVARVAVPLGHGNTMLLVARKP